MSTQRILAGDRVMGDLVWPPGVSPDNETAAYRGPYLVDAVRDGQPYTDGVRIQNAVKLEPQCPDTAADGSAVSLTDSDATPGLHAPTEDAPASPSDSPTATLDALRAAKELAEENAALKANLRTARKFLESERRRANEAEDDLAEVQWLCSALGFQGAADTEDLLQWLLGVLGHPQLGAALLRRRRLLAEIGQKEAALNQLAARLHWRVPPETNDRCACGKEARKLEGLAGFTHCDDCYRFESEK